MGILIKKEKQQKEFAKIVLKVKDEDRTVFHGSMLTVIRANGKRDMISWLDLPGPYYVVTKVMRDYRREQGYLECIPSASLADKGFGLSREARLLYVGMVAKILSHLGGVNKAVVEQMHPPSHIFVSMSDISKNVGINIYKVREVYDGSVMKIAPEMMRRELFLDFREELVG